jgi:protein-L-isoaspartate(D-aspartate) O-methyltransferase
VNISEKKKYMIEQLVQRGMISSESLLFAMKKIPQEAFLSFSDQEFAYSEENIVKDDGTFIQSPYLTAFITNHLGIDGTSRVLEIGPGTGDHTAVLSDIAEIVFSVEIHCPLAVKAKDLLDKMGYRNVISRCGNGIEGWKRAALFDAIVVSAGVSEVPESLLSQLAQNGRMIIPIGDKEQILTQIIKNRNNTFEKKELIKVNLPRLFEADEYREAI